MSNSLPVPEGIYPQRLLDQHMVTLGKITAATQFTDLTDELVFFNHALIEHIARLSHDPVAESTLPDSDAAVIATQGAVWDIPGPHLWQLPGDVPWTHSMLAYRKADWQPFFDYVRSLAIWNPVSCALYMVQPYVLQIVDPRWKERNCVMADKPPMLDVTVFGLVSKHGRYQLANTHGLWRPAGIVRLPPPEGMLQTNQACQVIKKVLDE